MKCPKCKSSDVCLSDEDEQGVWAECQECKHWWKVY